MMAAVARHRRAHHLIIIPPAPAPCSQALLWLSYGHAFTSPTSSQSAESSLRCLRQLRQLQGAEEMAARPVCSLIALKASLVLGNTEDACAELLQLVTNDQAEQGMCMEAVLECLKAGCPLQELLPTASLLQERWHHDSHIITLRIAKQALADPQVGVPAVCALLYVRGLLAGALSGSAAPACW